MKRMRISGLLSTEKLGIEVVAAGWVRTRRDSKGGGGNGLSGIYGGIANAFGAGVPTGAPAGGWS